MIDVNTLSPEERLLIEAKREYQKQWRANNKNKVKMYQKRFYKKKADELLKK